MNDKTHLIQNRFPDKSETISLLIQEDPEFREMCEDYDDCVNALHYWKNSKENDAEHRVKEYRTLIHELETEIMEVLDRTATSNIGD